MAFEAAVDTSAPLGTTAVESTTPDTGGTPAPESAPFKLTDDALVEVDGKSVKYGEHFRKFQGQFTKTSQRAAQLEKELAAERETRQRYENEKKSQPQGPNQPGLIDQLREKPYLSGADAAEMVSGIVAQFQSRDQVIQILAKELLSAKNILSGLHESSTNQSFDSKINKWVGELGYDAQAPGITDIAKEVYLAYQGSDLDSEFPRIFGERMKQIEAFFEAKRRNAVTNARRNPFVPGQGGQTSPSKPLTLDPRNSPRADAEALWEALQTGDRT